MPHSSWICAAAALLALGLFALQAGDLRRANATPRSGPLLVEAGGAGQPEDIKWFKDEMNIGSREGEEGSLGASWPQFVLTLLVAAFFIVTVFSRYLRIKRTREILSDLVEEEKEGQGGSEAAE